MNPYELAKVAANELREKSGVDRYDVAVVLGSGWREGAVALGTASSVVATSSLSGFMAPTVAGHSGQILSIVVGGVNVALVAGRVHLYEGHSAREVVHPVRTVIAAGATKVVLTNACGGLDLIVRPGNVAVIRDHLNFTGTSPMEGAPPPHGYGSRFVDLTDVYSARLRTLVHATVPGLHEGVYLGFRGPHYETPAEIEMARTLGASLVGMSTVLEAIAARHLDAEVLGLSLVSNFAAGVSTGPLNHLEVLETGQSAAASLGALLAQIIPVL
ncbi:MAG TPA: purine-nucleoside phosphorylase [Acidimicrobiales bacterium]|jgi:purine-nucleoside phosphorylase|nr:purine-nucleoside phosphorylase [Acidimicrobiales bacterium]